MPAGAASCSQPAHCSLMPKRKPAPQQPVQQKPSKRARAPKPAAPPAESDSDGPDQSDLEPSASMSPTAEVALEFFDPAPRDFQGVEALLRHYLEGSPLHCGDLVDALIQQASRQCTHLPEPARANHLSSRACSRAWARW